MVRSIRCALAASGLALVALLATACADDYGESCDLPNTAAINALCDPNGENNEATCVFRNSAQCSSRMCVRFQGIADFCSEDCSVAAGGEDCPGTSFCYPVPGGGDDEGVCVPESIADDSSREGSGS